MRSRNSLISSIFIISILFISACKREKVELPWTEIELPTENRLTDIYFSELVGGFITAGKDWEVGEILLTVDGGDTWQSSQIFDKLISGIDGDEIGYPYLTGYSGYYGNYNPAINTWNNYQYLTFSPYDDISTWDGNTIFTVSGEAYIKGAITKGDAYGNMFYNKEFDHDFEAIDHADENNITVCGYGQILHSSDQGENWTALPYTGDFFKDVHFPSKEVGYICGFSGSILKSTNSGATWKFLRDGDKLLVPDKRFNALHFESEEHGYLVGNNGLCWRTTNGGKKWQVLKKLPHYDFTGVFVFDTHAFIIAEEGKLIRVEH